MVLSCPLWALALGTSRTCRLRSAVSCALSRIPDKSYKAICRWLLLVLGLERPNCKLSTDQRLNLQPFGVQANIPIN